MEEIATLDECFFITKYIISWKMLLRLGKTIIKTMRFESSFWTSYFNFKSYQLTPCQDEEIGILLFYFFPFPHLLIFVSFIKLCFHFKVFNNFRMFLFYIYI